jgi:hypothetical protein
VDRVALRILPVVAAKLGRNETQPFHEKDLSERMQYCNMKERPLFRTELKAIQYLNKEGTADASRIRDASGSKGCLGYLMGSLEIMGLVESTETYSALGSIFMFYRLTKKGKQALKQNT